MLVFEETKRGNWGLSSKVFLEEDKEISIILGRPFLTMWKTLIYVERVELIIRVKKDEVNFKVFKPLETSYKVKRQEKVNAIHLEKKKDKVKNEITKKEKKE